MALLVYVDDVLITGSNESSIAALKGYLDDQFTIKELGYTKYFLGLEIARGDQRTYLNQRKYILGILKDMGLIGCKPMSILFPQGLKLQAQSGSLISNPT